MRFRSELRSCGRFQRRRTEESRVWKSEIEYTRGYLHAGRRVAGVIDTLFDRLASNANQGPTLAVPNPFEDAAFAGWGGELKRSREC
jgi:hypothetical protein